MCMCVPECMHVYHLHSRAMEVRVLDPLKLEEW